MKKANALILVLAVLLAAGCGGDEEKKEDPTPAQRTCQVTRSVSSQTISEFIYNSAGKVSRINYVRGNPNSNFHQEIFYNAAGNVSEIKTFDNNNLYDWNETYTYNADNLPIRYFSYYVDPAGIKQEMSNQSYQYNAAKQLVRMNLYGPQDTILSGFDLITYPAADEVAGKSYRKDMNGNMRLESSGNTHYDSMKNPYISLWFLSPGVLISTHNIISSTSTDHIAGTTSTNSFTYSYNSDGYPTQKNAFINGQAATTGDVTWTYNCQ